MSDAYSFGSNDDDTIGPPTPLKKFRSKYYEEMAQKPQVYRKLMALTQAEVGNQGPEAQQAFLESVFNRAAARGQTLDEAMQLVSKGGYYPGLGDYNKVSAETQTGYGDLLNQVRSGSNVGNYATGNASGTVGFNKGPQVAEYGGERYGIEGPDLKTMQGIAGGTIDPLEASTFDPTGRKRMANGDGAQGILGALGMQNQQPQGLLGALGDPETMAYIGMMLKGLSPYSNIDPNAMLSSAHTNALRKQALMQQQAEQARDNARADERLGFDRERFNLTKSEHEAQQTERKAQQERDRQALDRLAGGGSSTFTPDPAAVTDPATAEATTRRVQLEKRLESLNREWPQASEKLRPQLRMEIERTEKALGMSASESRTYSEAKEAKSGAETAKLQVDRAVDILQDPNLYEGLKKRGSEFVGGIIGESSLPDTARKTNELSRIMTTEGLQELAKHLKPLSEREGMLITSLMNNPGMALSEKKRRMEELQGELNKRVQRSSDTISDLEERERAGTAARRRGDSGNATRDALKNKYGLE